MINFSTITFTYHAANDIEYLLLVLRRLIISQEYRKHLGAQQTISNSPLTN